MDGKDRNGLKVEKERHRSLRVHRRKMSDWSSIKSLRVHVACEQALLFERAKQASRERASEGPLAASPLARAFSQDSLRLSK